MVKSTLLKIILRKRNAEDEGEKEKKVRKKERRLFEEP